MSASYITPYSTATHKQLTPWCVVCRGLRVRRV